MILKGGLTPSIPEIIWVKNVRAIVVCGFLMKSLKKHILKIWKKSWVTFRSYLLNSTANPAQSEWKWAGFLRISLKTHKPQLHLIFGPHHWLSPDSWCTWSSFLHVCLFVLSNLYIWPTNVHFEEARHGNPISWATPTESMYEIKTNKSLLKGCTI